MNNLTIVYLLLGLFIILISLFVYLKLTNKRSKKIIQSFNTLFNILSKTKLFSGKLQEIRDKLYNNSFSEDWIIKYKAISYLLISWIIGIVIAVFVVIYFNNNLYVTLTLLFFSFQIKNIVLNLLIGDDTNFLVGIYNYCTELQQAYSSSKDVQYAIAEANNNATNYSLVKRMEEIEKIIDDPIALEEYVAECPNDYLRLLIINFNLTMEYGDKKDIEGKSVFLENIFYIKQIIEMEVFKRRQLQFWLKGMPFFCIAPLLAFTPYEMWVHKTLTVTDSFYTTSVGFIAKIVITVICIACFYIIKGYADTSQKNPIKVKQTYWENSLLKFKPLKLLIFAITPKVNSRANLRYKNLINSSGEYTRVEYIFLRKVLFAIGGFIISLSIAASIHALNRSSILDNKTADFKSDIVIVNSEQKYSTQIEKETIQYADLNNIEKSYKVLTDKLRSLGVNDADTLAKKIFKKKEAIYSETLKWYELVISLIVAILLYQVPELMLRMKASMRKSQMENEIIIFETIILILMYHENSTSELILETMSKFADLFKVQVDEALKDIRKSDLEAMDLLIQELKYKPFINLIKNIVKAENIKTKEAFISLADNRRNYLMNRKEDNRRLVHKRVTRSSLISLIPANLVIICYIAIPMLYVAFVQLDNQDKMFNMQQNNTSIEMQK